MVLEATEALNTSGQVLAGPVPYLLEYWMIRCDFLLTI